MKWKFRKSKRNLIILTITAVILLAGLTALSVNLTVITVSGNHRYTSEQITQFLFSGRWDRNTVYCMLKDRFKPHRQLPFIEDYEIVFQSLNQAEVIVYEKSIVGYVTYMGSYLYFDKDGIIVESSSTRLDGVPRVTGLEFGHIVLHKRLPVEDERIFDEILDLTQVLSTHQIQVDKIQYDSHGDATLVIGEIDVILGDGDQMSGKVAKLSDTLPVLTGMSGTLYLDTYDEANLSKTYRFVKREQ